MRRGTHHNGAYQAGIKNAWQRLFVVDTAVGAGTDSDCEVVLGVGGEEMD